MATQNVRRGQAGKDARKAVANGTARADRPQQTWDDKDEAWVKNGRAA